MKSMGCASAMATWEAVGRGGSDGKLTSGIEWTGKPATGTFMTVGGLERASATTFSEPGVCPICGEIRDVRKVALLVRGLRWRNADHGGDQRLVICEEPELPTL